MDKIKHMVVVMLENRSLDNLLGFLYAAEQNRPPRNLPVSAAPTYDGLVPNQFANPGPAGQKIFASSPTAGPSPFTVPNPDPNEGFANITLQLFGTTQPADQQPATMSGFLADYLTAKDVTPGAAPHVMESYSPEQIPVLSALARNYAVCDAWFASVPAQTWPNRGFVHTGTAHGEVTNGNVFAYSTKTIYESLQEQGVTWAVYNDGPLMSLTRLQYPHLLLQGESHFAAFDSFKGAAAAGTLPAYSFVEPRFMMNPNDQHPPHDVAAGEQFLLDIWTAVSTGPGWSETLLMITYDEHGGCYDHVPPPWGAAIPDDRSNPGQQGFRFNRFGVRVPAVVISPLIEPGTVFRSPTATPYDHTSILATVRDWLAIPPALMPSSARIAAAPTLDQLLTRDTPRQDLPQIQVLRAAPPATFTAQQSEPLNDLQQSMLIAAETIRKKRSLNAVELNLLLQSVRTKGDVWEHLQRHGFTNG